MKKTLITIMALAGVASAATVSTIDKNDENLVSYVDFSTDSVTSGSVTYTNFASISDEGEYGIVEAGKGMYTNNDALTDAGLTSTQNFTVSFDIRSFGTGDLFSFGVSTCDDWKKIMLTSSEGSNLTLKFYGNSQSIDTGIAINKDKPRTEWTTITIVGDDSVTQGVKLYVDGIFKGAFDMTPATNWLTQNASGFQFAGSFRNEGTKVDFDGEIELDNLLVYKTALTADEVKSLIVPVPEPTTATLSLLALAGLAARRRRK